MELAKYKACICEGAAENAIEQNRYAMACRGCGIAIFCFL